MQRSTTVTTYNRPHRAVNRSPRKQSIESGLPLTEVAVCKNSIEIDRRSSQLFTVRHPTSEASEACNCNVVILASERTATAASTPVLTTSGREAAINISPSCRRHYRHQQRSLAPLLSAAETASPPPHLLFLFLDSILYCQREKKKKMI